jgi:PAS domain S-box-containing protein
MQLQESRALYHDLVDTSQDLIWMCDAEGRYTYLNPAWEEVLGYGLSDMLGRPYTDFIPPEWQGRERLLEERIVKGALLPHMDSNGRQRQLVFNAKTILDPEGAPSGFRGSAYDITERNLLEHELSSKVSELETVLAKVKQLEGILPICMYCKKIRKDTRSWQQLETYISEHSEALFSHSVCPECEGHQRREYDAMKSDRGEGSAP